MNEEWKIINDHPDYAISNLGNIKSFKRCKVGKLMQPTKHKSGYWQVHLYTGGKRISAMTYQLVAKEFLPKIHNGLEVDHIDGDRANTNVDNLQWVTSYVNMFKGKLFTENKRYNPKYYALSYPDGRVSVVRDLRNYAKAQGITNQHLFRVASGERNHYKHIRITRLETL